MERGKNLWTQWLQKVEGNVLFSERSTGDKPHRHKGMKGKEPNKPTADKPYSNGNPPEARACKYNEVTGRCMVIVEALCLKPYWEISPYGIPEGKQEIELAYPL